MYEGTRKTLDFSTSFTLTLNKHPDRTVFSSVTEVLRANPVMSYSHAALVYYVLDSSQKGRFLNEQGKRMDEELALYMAFVEPTMYLGDNALPIISLLD